MTADSLLPSHPPTADDLAHASKRPSAPVQTEVFRVPRPVIVGPDVPEDPFPISMKGPVQKGFGRGGKDLGCPTGIFLVSCQGNGLANEFIRCEIANLPDDTLHPMATVASPGIYFGYAQVVPHTDETPLPEDDRKVYPMAMSLGWNPFYKNEQLSAVCMRSD